MSCWRTWESFSPQINLDEKENLPPSTPSTPRGLGLDLVLLAGRSTVTGTGQFGEQLSATLKDHKNAAHAALSAVRNNRLSTPRGLGLGLVLLAGRSTMKGTGQFGEQLIATLKNHK